MRCLMRRKLRRFPIWVTRVINRTSCLTVAGILPGEWMMFFGWGQRNTTMTSEWSVAKYVVRRYARYRQSSSNLRAIWTLGPPASVVQLDRSCLRFTPESEMHEASLLIERMSAIPSASQVETTLQIAIAWGNSQGSGIEVWNPKALPSTGFCFEQQQNSMSVFRFHR
jgi:hypothetical protein